MEFVIGIVIGAIFMFVLMAYFILTAVNKMMEDVWNRF